MLCSLSFKSTSENFEFRWSITGFILKALSVLSSFLLSAKCRFCVIVFWILSLSIRLSALQYSARVSNILIAITKFILRNAFSSSLVTVKFLPLWWVQRFDCSTINSSSSSRSSGVVVMWPHGLVVIMTAQLHSTQPELRLCACSNHAFRVPEIRGGEDLWQWSWLEIRLNAFRRSTIPQEQLIIHHDDHRHQRKYFCWGNCFISIGLCF